MNAFIHSFITNIYLGPLQGHYSEALPTFARLKRSVDVHVVRFKLSYNTRKSHKNRVFTINPLSAKSIWVIVKLKVKLRIKVKCVVKVKCVGQVQIWGQGQIWVKVEFWVKIKFGIKVKFWVKVKLESRSNFGSGQIRGQG